MKNRIEVVGVAKARPDKPGPRPPATAEGDKPVRRLTDPRLDFPHPVLLCKSYVVASTDRSGSTFLCSMLWRSGVLGAPAEYWNYRNRTKSKTVGVQMMERLEAKSPDDYLTKLLAKRTSANGVFGLNAHYFDFEEAINGYPTLLERLSPLTYIYIRREDKIAQAVSMVKAAQTGAWVSLANARNENLQYDRDLITRCLNFLDQQDRGWARWFGEKGISPFVVVYESLAARPSIIVQSIMELMGVQNDTPQKVLMPEFEKQSDSLSQEWINRYRRESEAAAVAGFAPTPSAADESAGSGMTAAGARGDAHAFDRFDQARAIVAKPIDAKRLRHRYDAIIGANRSLFKNATVLDVQCGDGRWSFAALDAGAEHVVGLDTKQEPVEAAKTTFAKLGVKPASYEFVNSQTFAGLRAYAPETFDVIVCQDLSKTPDLHFLFNQLRRLRPEHVILDTAVVGGKVPIAVFKFKGGKNGADGRDGRSTDVDAVPNHEFIRILCDFFGFRWRLFDWRSVGISDWTGVRDYERDKRRTYVLERSA